MRSLPDGDAPKGANPVEFTFGANVVVQVRVAALPATFQLLERNVRVGPRGSRDVGLKPHLIGIRRVHLHGVAKGVHPRSQQLLRL